MKPLKKINNLTSHKKRMNKKIFNKKHSQTTIFIILAIVIVVGFITYFLFRGSLIFSNIPAEFQPVYNFYLSCIDQETLIGTSILGQQGGYIQGPDFSPGSSYMPFSSHLNFVGIPIPYWYFITGNGLVKEQVPSKENMESELNEFLETKLLGCDFTNFAQQGFDIKINRDINVETNINDNNIDVNVNQELIISKGDDSWTSNKHSKEVSSSLGKFYDLSKKIYEDYKETMFLENYGVDILRLYAPVDGVKIQCNPAVWKIEEVRANITRALEANIPFTKIRGDYYNLKNKDNEYFVHDIPSVGKIDANVNFLFSRNWPNKMEVWPNDQGLLIAEAVGTQEGLGMLGFCYVPYHFVYDLAYPVLIQLYFNDELFQFPVVVFINKNRPREPIDGQSIPNAVPELCLHRNTEITVSTFNSKLEPIEADIDFKCLATTCDIGNTKLTSSGNDAILSENFPQCGNGFIIASAEGYETKKQIFSTINKGSTTLFLDRKYIIEVELEGFNSIENAIVTFTKDKKVKTIAYPNQKNIELSVGQYEIKTYVYSDSSISLEASSQQKCIDVPKSGVLGAFGFNEEKCFDLEIPSQSIDTAIAGGGTQNYFISETELENSKKIVITTNNFGKPTEIQDLQINFNRVDISGMGVRFE